MSNNHLTLHQEILYTFIKGYIAKNGHSPYLREIQEACNIKSHKSVIDRLVSLERKGYIKRKINQHRSIRLLNNCREEAVLAESLT